MFNLNYASRGIRKAAAMRGVKSGKWEPYFDRETQDDTAVVAVIYNRNHPDGIEIMQGEAELADHYTWEEIKST